MSKAACDDKAQSTKHRKHRLGYYDGICWVKQPRGADRAEVEAADSSRRH